MLSFWGIEIDTIFYRLENKFKIKRKTMGSVDVTLIIFEKYKIVSIVFIITIAAINFVYKELKTFC